MNLVKNEKGKKMIKPKIFLFIAISFTGILLILSGCSFLAKSREPKSGENSVSSETDLTVSVKFNNAPQNGLSLDLMITGDGMDDVTKSYPVTQISDSFMLPPGLARTFIAVSSTPSVTLSAVVQKDILSTADADIILNLLPTSSKIIVPDAMNNRIVQLDDMTGTGWKTRDYSSFGLAAGEFVPYDIDIDSKGRIYIANNYTTRTASKPQIIRIDDLNNPNPVNIIEGMANGVVAITIDRLNGWIYYATDYGVYRSDYEGLNQKQYTYYDPVNNFPNGVFPKGLAVDENGMVYIVWNPDSSGDAVNKFDPSSDGTPIAGGVINNTWGGFGDLFLIYDTWDVLVKSNSVYTVNYSGDNGYRILQFDKDLINLTGNYGDTVPSQNPGEFYGPRRFVAILNNKLTITDEDPLFDYDRLVSLDDTLDGTGWVTYGSSGLGTGQFYFYNQYAQQ